MKTSHWKTGKRAGLVLVVGVLCGTAGCSFFPHRELTAPCSDYKAASYTPASSLDEVPCDDPLPLVRTLWTAALEPPARANEGAAPRTVTDAAGPAWLEPTG